MTHRAIYDRLHYEGFIAGSGDDGYRGNVRSAIKRIRNEFRDLDPDFAEIENYTVCGYRWVSRPARTEQPQYSFRPWAHSSMDCLMQQHPFQKLLDFSIGIRLGKQSSVFRCFTK